MTGWQLLHVCVAPDRHILRITGSKFLRVSFLSVSIREWSWSWAESQRASF